MWKSLAAWAGEKAGCSHGLAGVSLLPEGQPLFGLILCFLSGELTAGAGPEGVPVPERSVQPTGAGDRPVPSWDGKTCVGVFCASPHLGAQSRWRESWRGSGKVGAFPGGLVVEQHSRRADAGSAPGMSPGTFSAPGRPPLLGVEVAPLGAATVSPGRARTRHCGCRPCWDGRFHPVLPGLVGGTGAALAPPGSPLLPRCSPRPVGQGRVCPELAEPLSSSCDGRDRRAKDYACAWVWMNE